MKNKIAKKMIELPINKLLPYEFNNKNHPKKQIDTIKNSILECWYLADIIVDENNVILAGHWRYLALQELWHETIQVQQVVWLTDVQKKKFRIMDNASAELAEYNIENLQIDLQDIDDADFTALVCEIANIDMQDPNSLGDEFSLPSGTKWEIVTMSFTLHQSQAEQVERAIQIAKDMWQFGETWNTNSNWNAIARVCEVFITQNGNE